MKEETTKSKTTATPVTEDIPSEIIYKDECKKQDYTTEMIEYLLGKLKTISIDAVHKVTNDIKNGKQEDNDYGFWPAIERTITTKSGYLLEDVACYAPWSRNISKQKKKVSDIEMYLHQNDGIKTFELKTSRTTKTGTDKQNMITNCKQNNTHWVILFRQKHENESCISELEHLEQNKYSTSEFWKHAGCDYEKLLSIWNTRKHLIYKWVQFERDNNKDIQTSTSTSTSKQTTLTTPTTPTTTPPLTITTTIPTITTTPTLPTTTPTSPTAIPTTPEFKSFCNNMALGVAEFIKIRYKDTNTEVQRDFVRLFSSSTMKASLFRLLKKC